MSQIKTITLGGGCFWCTEAVYVKVRGVTDVESGYSNGQVARPSYEDVCSGSTGSNEVVKLVYDLGEITPRQSKKPSSTISSAKSARTKPSANPSSPKCCHWPTTGPPRPTTKTTSRTTPIRVTAWRWQGLKSPSSARRLRRW